MQKKLTKEQIKHVIDEYKRVEGLQKWQAGWGQAQVHPAAVYKVPDHQHRTHSAQAREKAPAHIVREDGDDIRKVLAQACKSATRGKVA